MPNSNLIYHTPRGEAALRLVDVPDEGMKLAAMEVRAAPAGIDLLEPVRLELKLLREEDGYAVIGGFPYRVKVTCCRCLEPFEFAGKAAFAYFMLPAAQAPKNDETHLDDADMDLVYFEDDELLLNRLVEEQLLLSVPGKPLCKEPCLGLCPQCGQNLNLGGCQCVPLPVGSPSSVFDKIADDIFGKNH